MISFAQPWPLLLLPLLLGWTLWRVPRLQALSPGRRAAIATLRCSIFALLVLAVAEARLVRVQDDLSVFFALDWSDSVPEEQRELALEFIQEALGRMAPDDRAGLIIFGRDPSIERAPQALPELPAELADVQSDVSAGRTNIAGALRLALAALPESSGRRIVLLSDGNQNFGEAAEAARLAQDGGVPIDVFPLRQVAENDVRISRVDVPGNVYLEQPFDVRVFVDSDHDGEATLRLYEDERPIREQRVELQSDLRNVFFIPRQLTAPGFHRYRAEVEVAGDANPNNNTAQAFTSARGEPRVLLVDSEAQLASDLYRALRREQIDVELREPEGIPMSLAELQSYDSVILSNVAAAAMSRGQMEMIERGVHDLGIGFIMLGGPDSFGPGGYQDTPIERLLPVRMDISHRRVLPNGALTIVLHTCEIADGNAWARDISEAALDVLSSRDYFGLLYYGPLVGADPSQYSNYGYNWLGEPDPQPVGDKSVWRNLIKSVNPGDMPDFDTTLQMAYDGLSRTHAALKHVIIISDGDPAPPNPRLAQAIYDAGISISTIVIAPHHPQNATMMQTLANQHGGRFYYPTSPSQLPQIFIREATVVRRSMIDETPFAPLVDAPSEAMPGFSPGQTLPTLSGHVVTEAQPGAQVPIATGGEGNDPVFAHWRYGLGHTAAFTSDAKARWASQWLGWDQYARFWSQVVRWSLRNSAERNFRVTTQMNGAEGLITVDAIGDDSQFINFLDFQGRLIPPSYDADEVRPITFRQTAPGRYEGRFEVDDIGSYMVSIAADTASGETALLTAGLSLSYSPEFQTNQTNTQLLTQLADVTGGRMNVGPRGVFDRGLRSSRSLTPIWPWLLSAALLLLPLDIFLRRVMVDWADVRRFGRAGSTWLSAHLVPRRRVLAERDATTAAMLEAKGRVREVADTAATAEDKRRLQEALSQVKAQRDIVTGIERAPERPRISPQATGGGEAKPAVKPGEEGYTQSLLEAKRRAKRKM